MGGDTVIITGASRGIGAALSIELDKRGYRVAGLSRTGDPPLGCEDPSRFLLRKCDVTDEKQLRDSFAWVKQQTKEIKCLVNNLVEDYPCIFQLGCFHVSRLVATPPMEKIRY